MIITFLASLSIYGYFEHQNQLALIEMEKEYRVALNQENEQLIVQVSKYNS